MKKRGKESYKAWKSQVQNVLEWTMLIKWRWWMYTASRIFKNVNGKIWWICYLSVREYSATWETFYYQETEGTYQHNDMLVSAKHEYDKLFILTCRNFGLFLVKTIPKLYFFFMFYLQNGVKSSILWLHKRLSVVILLVK